jgi:hypothetical protein
MPARSGPLSAGDVVEVVGMVGVVLVLVPSDGVVVVVTPPHEQALQESLPQAPSPASHASPPPGSKIPSPQVLNEARNGFKMPDDLAVKVADIRWHSSVMKPERVAFPRKAGHDFQ